MNTSQLPLETVSGDAIPKVIHFTWGLLQRGQSMPSQYRENLNQWVTLNPQWQMQMHDLSSIEAISLKYPSQPFSEYQYDIQRADVCRPMLLHSLGGIYCDLDVVPLQGLDLLFRRYPAAEVLLVEETLLSWWKCILLGLSEPVRQGKPECGRRIANYFMASRSGHPFWLDVLELMKQRCAIPVKRDYDVLYTTGPDVISEIVQSIATQYSEVVIVSKVEIDSFITHQCSGTWRRDR